MHTRLKKSIQHLIKQASTFSNFQVYFTAVLRRPGNGDNNGKCIKLTKTRSLSCLPFLPTTSVNFFQLLDWFPYTCIYQANNEKVGSLYLHKHCTCIYNTFINQHDQTLWGRVRTTQTAPIFP